MDEKPNEEELQAKFLLTNFVVFCRSFKGDSKVLIFDVHLQIDFPDNSLLASR